MHTTVQFDAALHESHHAGVLYLSGDVTLVEVRIGADGSGSTKFSPAFPEDAELAWRLDQWAPGEARAWFQALLISALAPDPAQLEPGDREYLERLCTAWDQVRQSPAVRTPHPPARTVCAHARQRAALWRVRYASQCRSFASVLAHMGHLRGVQLHQELARHFGPSPKE